MNTGKFKSLRDEASGQASFITGLLAHGSSPSLRASEGCVAIQKNSSFCHSELDSESIQHCKLAVLAGKILNRVQDDSYDNSHNEPLTPHTTPLTRAAFTMAEILLSLTIIGVVAAITLPSLTGNLNERTWNTQRKALYSRMSQAVSLMPALNSFGTLSGSIGEDGTQTITSDNVAETFISNGLSKVMKINNICAGTENLTNCGVVSKIITIGGVKIDLPTTAGGLNEYNVGSRAYTVDKMSVLDTKAAAFETQNGETIITYYNPRCVGSLNETGKGYGGIFYGNKVCANFIYDLNGKKGPNTVGKDIGFITAMYPSDVHVVAPMPAVKPLTGTYKIQDTTNDNATKACTVYDPEMRLPNVEELISMSYNKALLEQTTTVSSVGSYWSSSPVSHNTASTWALAGWQMFDDFAPTRDFNVWCVKR